MFRVAIALLLSLSSSLLAESWHGSDGQLIANGAVTSVDGESANVQLTGKSTATLRLDDLSLADRAYLKTRDKADSEFQKPQRQWTNVSGSFHIDGKAIAFIDDTNVRLTRADSKVISIPIEKLSSEDREYLSRLKEAAKPSAPASTVATVAPDDPFSTVESFSGTASAEPPKTFSKSVRRSAAKPSTRENTSDVSRPNIDSVDRNPYSEQVTGSTPTGIPAYTGPRGGTYHYSASGNKVYSKHK